MLYNLNSPQATNMLYVCIKLASSLQLIKELPCLYSPSALQTWVSSAVQAYDRARLSKVLKYMTIRKAWKTDIVMQGVGKNSMCQPRSKKGWSVHLAVNNAWKRLEATVVEAV